MKTWVSVLKNGLGMLAVILCIGILAGCDSKETSFEGNLAYVKKNVTLNKYYIDQIFRKNGGYLISYRSEKSRIFEKTYYSCGFESGTVDSGSVSLLSLFKALPEYREELEGLNGYEHIALYKDLKPQDKPYFFILECDIMRGWDNCLKTTGSSKDHGYYVEIHLPENYEILHK